MMNYLDWEGRVIQWLIDTLEIDRGDAQGLTELPHIENILKSEFERGTYPHRMANIIDRMSRV